MAEAEPVLPRTESADPRYRALDTWPTASAVHALWEAQLAAASAVGAAVPALAAAVDAAAERLRNGGRLAYAGAGTSGRLAVLDGVELPPTFGWPRARLLLLLAGGNSAFTGAVEDAEDDSAAAEREVARHAMDARDVLVAVAASGTTAYTRAALRAAGAAGALTIAIANSPGAPLLAEAGHAILLATGAEPLAGSTRLKAGTAQKAALNIFSTALMSRLGGIHDGLMVDMEASNAKLRDRAMRMLVALAGCNQAQARGALAATGSRVKPAVLVLRGLSPAQAEEHLAAHGGSLRAALAALPA